MPYIVTARLTDGSRGYLNRSGGFSRDRALARVYKQRYAADVNAEKWGGQVEELADETAQRGNNMLSEREHDILIHMSKDELIRRLLEAERQRDQLRAACEAAIDYIIAVYAHKLWNEHPSYDREKARKVAEANPPDVVVQLRAALDKAGVSHD